MLTIDRADIADSDRESSMGTKKALLVGINYRGASGINELNGCCNDARRLSNVLMNFYGFEGTDIDILVDEPADEERDLPTHANIHKYLNKLIDGAQSGDTLVFSFSGHGGRVKVTESSEDVALIEIPDCGTA